MIYGGTDQRTIAIFPGARELMTELAAHGFSAYAVGGCVRDSLRGAAPHDWDICTSATPDEMHAVFAGKKLLDTGLKHGTVTVLSDGRAYEITTFRTDGDYLDGRHPSSVRFTRSLEEDLRRRDFTVNAMAAGADGAIVDLFGGRRDLAAGVIRCVGEPRERFREDALRILRAMRFAATLGFSLDPATEAAMHEERTRLALVSGERVLEELMKLLAGGHAERVLLSCGDILSVPIPEIEPCINFEHRNRWHHLDVWAHTCHAVGLAPRDWNVRLALLLHDLAKPLCASDKPDGGRRFHGHPVRGAELAEARLRALNAPRKLTTLVTSLVRLHDEDMLPEPANAGRFLRELGDDGALLLAETQLADARAHYLAYPPALERVRLVAAAHELMRSMISSEAPYLHSRLSVSGADVAALGFEGEEIARTLDALCDLVCEGKAANERAALLDAAKEMQTPEPSE